MVSLSKNINPSLVLVQPRKTRPFITERLLMGRKESIKQKQINTHTCSYLYDIIYYIIPEASSTMRALASAHCTDARLYTLRIKIGTSQRAPSELSHYWTHLCYNPLHASEKFCRLPIAFCKQFEPRWRPTECQSWSGSKLFDTPMVVPGGLFVKTLFWRKSADQNKNMNNSLACKKISTGRLQKNVSLNTSEVFSYEKNA